MKTLTAVLAVSLAASTAHAERDYLDLMTEGAAKANAGEHGAAIGLFELAYILQPDPALLPIIASEYRRAGLSSEAMLRFCDYLVAQPKGPHAPFAAMQVLAIRAELGMPVTRDRVCEQPAPVQIDFVTPRRTPYRPGVAPRELSLLATSEPAPGLSRREYAGIATAAVGLASLGISLYYGARAKEISDTISSQDPAQPWPGDIHAVEARGQRFEDRQNLFLIAGGAALVTAGVLYVTGRADRLSSEQVVVAPSVTHGGAGISFARGF